MTDLSDIIAVDSIDASLAASNKKSLFHMASIAAGRRAGLDPRVVAAALAEREKLGSTGFGGGTAIPHGKIEGLDSIFGYFARLPQPIAYQAIDGLPVDLVFVLLSPPDAGADHLKALARVSRLLRDQAIVAKLRGARSEDAIFALLTGGDEAAHAG